jgi:CubicO group peptidase (beta-lactamase class C family)
VNPPELTRSIAAIQRGIDEGAQVGAQLAVSWDGTTFGAFMGIAGPGVAMTPSTLLSWFSATKPITAVAVLQLWERGALELDDRVALHIPEFGANGKDAVTVRHVLTHTGGFPNAPDSLEAVYAAPLEPGWIPGQRAAYHPRSGFLVLGELVQRLDGRPFDAYVNEEIFEPLDMADAWMSLPPARFRAYGDRMGVMYSMANPKDPQPAPWAAEPTSYVRVHAGGSALGPATDLLKFYECLLRGGAPVLSKQAVEAMTARHRTSMRDETFNSVIDWGLGVMVNSWHYRQRPTPYGYGDHAGRRAFGHGGAESSLSFADPDNGLAVALVFNGMPGEARNHRRTQRVVNALYQDLGLASVG